MHSSEIHVAVAAADCRGGRNLPAGRRGDAAELLRPGVALGEADAHRPYQEQALDHAGSDAAVLPPCTNGPACQRHRPAQPDCPNDAELAHEPRLPEFERVRQTWDPEGRLKSALAVRVLGERP